MLKFYLTLTILGVLLPYGALVPWIIDYGLNPIEFFQQIIANPISIFAWLDVLVSAVALIGFILIDGKLRNVEYRYFAVLGTLSVGVSCGLPLYLYLRER